MISYPQIGRISSIPRFTRPRGDFSTGQEGIRPRFQDPFPQKHHPFSTARIRHCEQIGGP